MQIYVIAGFEEKASSLPEEILLYSKGDEVIRKEYPFFPKDATEHYYAFPALAIRIGKLGKEVAPRFAARYINKIGVGLDIIAFQALQKAQKSGTPWEEAVSFQDAVGLSLEGGDFGEDFKDFYTVSFSFKEGEGKGEFTISGKLLATAVSKLSYYRKIRQGDLLLLHPSSPLVPDKNAALLLEREKDVVAIHTPTTYCLKIR